MVKFDFVAPTQDIENEIVDYCVNTLALEFGDFWYEWFDSNKPGNHTIHINSMVKPVMASTVQRLSFIGHVFKVEVMPLIAHPEWKFMTIIHFSSKPELNLQRQP